MSSTLGTRRKNVIKRRARPREPLPETTVKVRQPKSLPNPPGRPNVLMMLPTIVMALSVGVVSYFFSSGSGGIERVAITALPMMLMGGMMITVQLVQHRSTVRKHEAEVARINKNYTEHLEAVREKLEHYATEQYRILTQENPSLRELMKRVERRSAALWERQPFDDDFLSVRLGVAPQPLGVEVKLPDLDGEDPRLEKAHQIVEEYKQVERLPIRANLNLLGTLGIQGRGRSEALYLAFTIVANIIAHHSPDEVNLYILSHRPDAAERWGWTRWLPHTNAIHTRMIEQSRLSFNPGTDEPVLLGLSQILRDRSDKDRRAGASDGGQTEPHLVVIFDNVPELRGHVVIDKLLSHHPGDEENILRASAVFVDTPIPPQINAMVTVNGAKLEYRETWAADANQVQIRGASNLANARQMEKMARQMAPLHTEESFGKGGGLPSSVRLVELLDARQPEDIDLDKFYSKTYEPKGVLSFPVGLNVDLKPQMIHLREAGLGGFGSHAMLAGMTGTGKSVLLQAMVLSMALHTSPAHLNLVLADFKGGASELAKLKDLPHVVGFVTDLDTAMVERFRIALESEIFRRKELFDRAKEELGRPVASIRAYNETLPEEPLPHLVVLLDEFAHGLHINPDFQQAIDTIAAQGRALGVHLVLSTQRAADFDNKIRPNIDIRMSLRVASKEDSKIMFNRVEAFSNLTRPGQAYLQVGDNEVFEMFQAARADVPYLTEGTVTMQIADQFDDFAIYRVASNGRRQLLHKHEAKKKKQKVELTRSEAEVLVEHVQTYCREYYRPARIICLPSLPHPEDLALSELLANESLYQIWNGSEWSVESNVSRRLQVPVGMLDLPAQQTQLSFIVDLNQRDGNYMVIGPSGAGKSLFLRSLILGLVASHDPSEVQFYILSRGPDLAIFEGLPHCGAIIRPMEFERIERLFSFLESEIERRQTYMRDARVDSMETLRSHRPELTLPALVVIFEDFGGFRADHENKLELVQKLAGDCQSVDIHLLISSNAINNVHVRIQDNFRNRLALNLKSRADYIDVLGTRKEVLKEISGRGYTIVNQEALECQIALPVLNKENDAERSVKAQLQQTLEVMQEVWQGELPVAIKELPRHLDLEGLWEEYPYATDQEDLITAPIALDYEQLEPVSINFGRLETYNLVLGPAESGKTDFLTTLSLATAVSISPLRVRIVILAPSRSSLWLLDELPHVSVARSPEQAEQLLNRLKEAPASLSKAGSVQPDRNIPTLLILDDMQTLMRRVGGFATLVDECAERGKDSGIYIFFSDTANSLKFAKNQSYGFQSLQSACQFGSGLTFALEQTSLNLLQIQLSSSALRQHRSTLGKGRAYFVNQNRPRVVQFATLASSQGDRLAQKERIKTLVKQIATQEEYVREGQAI